MSTVEKIIQYIFVLSIVISMFISLKTSYDVHQQQVQITEIQKKVSALYMIILKITTKIIKEIFLLMLIL